MKRIIIITELYYPVDVSTGYFLTGIAEGIAQRLGEAVEVHVICAGQDEGAASRTSGHVEVHNRVIIHRVGEPCGDPKNLLPRVWRFFSLSIRIAWKLFREVRAGDLVIGVSNPPSVPILMSLLCRKKSVVTIFLVHDVYPDALVPAGLLSIRNPVYRGLHAIQVAALRRMQRILILGRDMEARILSNVPEKAGFTRIIPNWGELQPDNPCHGAGNPVRISCGLTEKFVIQFSGNLGRTHGLDDLLGLARHFARRGDVHFLVFGTGSGRGYLASKIEAAGLGNVTILPYCRREELAVHLSAADLAFIAYKQGMEGISVPSRMYNIMAAGVPILAACSAQSEIAQVLIEEGIGLVVEPANLKAIIEAVEHLMTQRCRLEAMGKRARQVVHDKYSREAVVSQYEEQVRVLLQAEG